MTIDSKDRYGRITRGFHWIMALLIGWQLLKFGDRIAEGEHWVGETLVPWHISIGLLLLVMITLRIFWAIAQRNNRPEQDPNTALLVKGGHFLLYAAMVLMPVTGVLVMVGNGYGLTAFGVQLAARGDDIPWAAAVGSLHSPLAWFLLVMVIGHIGMAMLHHFVKRDGVLQRMV